MDPNNQSPAALPPQYQLPPQQAVPQAAVGQPYSPGPPPPMPPISGDPNSEQSSLPPKQQIVERIKQANNVLVTVSNNPSVDQLASCIGLTLLLNKLGKHATAVFSGSVPSTIEFLQPEKTIEKNIDSLRDFIIALDKSKADKLRYKIEDKYVKIFITPYRTSLSDKDLEFSQGDFNVEVVIALGVHHKEELDQAITAHGRILHDATVISVNDKDISDLGAINWNEVGASSLSELVVSLGESLQPGVIDAQMATALLTGIVAETERFSNNKTSAVTMGIASQLMKSGANQQLIATKLEKPAPPPIPAPEEKKEDIPIAEVTAEMKPKEEPNPTVEKPKSEVGTLQIPHSDGSSVQFGPTADDEANPEQQNVDKIRIDDQGELHRLEDAANSTLGSTNPSRMIVQPPTMGGTLTANTMPESEGMSNDPLSLPSVDAQAMDRPATTQQSMPTSDFGSNTQSQSSIGLADQAAGLDTARSAINNAQNVGEQKLEPIDALNSQPIDLEQKKNETGSAPLVPPPMLPPAQ